MLAHDTRTTNSNAAQHSASSFFLLFFASSFRIFDSELLAVLVVQDGAMALTLSLPLALVGGPVTFLWTVTSMALLLMVALVFRFRFRDRLLKSLWGATGKQPGLFLLGLLSMCLIFGFMSRGVGLNMLCVVCCV
jgi:hypothetical protein